MLYIQKYVYIYIYIEIHTYKHNPPPQSAFRFMKAAKEEGRFQGPLELESVLEAHRKRLKWVSGLGFRV